MPKFRFKSARKSKKINFIKSEDEIIDTEILNGSHIEMFSNKKLILDGCQNIFEYENDYIKLKLKKGVLILFGSEFSIVSFDGEIITIKGIINSIEFCL